MTVTAACGGSTDQTASGEVVSGECRQVFGGDVCTWGYTAGGTITEFGATVAMAAIENAPPEGEMVFPPLFEAVVPLPAEVAKATGFDHLGVNWERHGHPPALFLTPHFDFHFYPIAPAEVQAIDCTDTGKPAALPDGYTLPDIDIPGMGVLTGLCVPTMGMHAMQSAELTETEPFDASMIVGYYRGENIFLEPMISRAALARAQSFEMPVPSAPPGLKDAVRWPSAFRAVYDETQRTYRFVFSLPQG
jgi:hypothetical protein